MPVTGRGRAAMSKPRGPVRFIRILAENWRNFTHVESALERRVLVTGPVAGGKSNFLDVFRFLSEVAAGGGLGHAVAARGGMARLRCLAATSSAEIALVAGAAGEDGAPEWEYELRLAQDAQRRPVVARERVSCAGVDLLLRPDECDRHDAPRLCATALEQVHANRDFRELAEFFASIRSVGEDVRDLPAAMGALPENAADSRLRRILELVRPLVPQLEALDFRRDSRGAPHLRARFGYSQGAWQTEEQLSGGTLRAIALLWAALDGAGPLLIEEPERSLDRNTARQILSLLRTTGRRGERQLLIATHSSTVLSDETILPEEVLELAPGEDGTTARTPSCFTPALNEDQLVLFPES